MDMSTLVCTAVGDLERKYGANAELRNNCDYLPAMGVLRPLVGPARYGLLWCTETCA